MPRGGIEAARKTLADEKLDRNIVDMQNVIRHHVLLCFLCSIKVLSVRRSCTCGCAWATPLAAHKRMRGTEDRGAVMTGLHERPQDPYISV